MDLNFFFFFDYIRRIFIPYSMLVFKEFKKINFRTEISIQDKNDLAYLRNLKDTISICHCKGHDTILSGIYFKGW